MAFSFSLAVKVKGQKSPKHGISRLFSNKKKNYFTQPPKISGPVETAIITSSVQMSDEDRKNLMLQVKHGDITVDQALVNFQRLIFYVQKMNLVLYSQKHPSPKGF